ncbi:MAG: rod shape-determining protein MreC [Lachnospirales bacterium]
MKKKFQKQTLSNYDRVDKLRLFKIIFIVIAIILLVLTGLFSVYPATFRNTFNSIITPIQNATSSFSESFFDTIRGKRDKSYLETENERLKLENQELLMEVNRLEQVSLEYSQMAKLLETKETYPSLNTTTAKVIGKGNSNWQDNYIIDKGIEHGIEENMVVLSYGSLLGRVVEVSEYSSKIITILDDSASISAVSSRTYEQGLFKGDINLMADRLCKFEYYNLSSELMVGDEIMTSELSTIYPPGIAIGEVVSLEKSSTLTQKAIVKPNVDFDNITTVLVVTDLFTKSTNTNNETISSTSQVDIDGNAGE